MGLSAPHDIRSSPVNRRADRRGGPPLRQTFVHCRRSNVAAMITDTSAFADLRVVLLDDNRNFQQVMRTILRSIGFRRIDVLSEADRFISHLEHHHVDLAFVDLVMTGTGGSRTAGLTLIAQARRTATVINRSLPMVLVTGHASRSVVTSSIAAGADHVLAKPVSPRSIVAVARAMMQVVRDYAPGADGYFGPDRVAARVRLDGRIDQMERAVRPAAPSGRAESRTLARPHVPGLNVAIRSSDAGADAAFLD